MATLTERNVVLVSKDSSGNTCLDYPLTKAEQVEDLESYVKNHSTQLKLPLSITGGGTGATNAADALTNLGISTTNFNPTGSILPFAGSSIPSGYLACNGSAISRRTYSALYNVIGTKYGSGDGSTTFNLPNLEDNRFMEFHSTPATKKNAGLPNIRGYIDKIRVMLNTQYETSGAFSGSVSIVSGDANAGSAKTVKFNFDASKGGSTLYGASTTVQPKSLTVRAIIKY